MSTTPLRHLRTAMTGRDPHESGRTATTLELMFDLTFVVAFGTAADELAHLLVEDHVGAGVGGFLFATFAISWAWINFTWFASAYDTDDWIYRLTTMVQMIGVLILSLGLAGMFESLVEGEHVDNGVMVLGYVVMRVPMAVQWLRAGRADPERAVVCRTMLTTLVLAQVGWIVVALVHLSLAPTLAAVVVLVLVEVSGPALAERQHGGTPWHAHHVAERYGLMIIIALGEGLLGTTAALGALVAEGWTLDVALLGLAGVALPFGMWWMYFTVPSGELLHHRRDRSFGWGYGHIAIFGAVVAVGAGLHTGAYYLEHHSALGLVGTVLTVAVPLAVYTVGLFVMYSALTRTAEPLHLVLVAVSAGVIGAALLLAGAGVSLSWCLLVLALTPWVTVVGYETVGHRHHAEVLASLEGPEDSSDPFTRA